MVFYCIGTDEKVSEAINLEALLAQSPTSKPPEPKQKEFHGMTFQDNIYLTHQNLYMTFIVFLF